MKLELTRPAVELGMATPHEFDEDSMATLQKKNTIDFIPNELIARISRQQKGEF